MVENGRGVTNAVIALKHLLEQQARLLGDFVLSSGRESQYYFNAKPVTFDPEGVRLVADVMLPFVREAGANCVGGLEIGAVPIAFELSKVALEQKINLPSCIVRVDKKKHGTKDQTASSYRFEQLKDRRMAVVDDVITTGNSVDVAIDVLRILGCQITCVLALVTRPEAGGIPAMKDKFGDVEYISIFECDSAGNLSPAYGNVVAVG